MVFIFSHRNLNSEKSVDAHKRLHRTHELHWYAVLSNIQEDGENNKQR